MACALVQSRRDDLFVESFAKGVYKSRRDGLYISDLQTGRTYLQTGRTYGAGWHAPVLQSRRDDLFVESFAKGVYKSRRDGLYISVASTALDDMVRIFYTQVAAFQPSRPPTFHQSILPTLSRFSQ